MVLRGLQGMLELQDLQDLLEDLKDQLDLPVQLELLELMARRGLLDRLE